VTVAGRAASPLTQALVADGVGSEERVRTMARLRSVRNAGFGLGALLATVPLALDTREAYNALLVADGVSFAVAAMMLSRLRREPTNGADAPMAPSPRQDAGSRGMLVNRPFIALTVLSAVLRLDESILAIGLPLWVDRYTEASRALVGPLFAVNTALVVLLQVRLSDVARDNATAARAMRSAGMLLATTSLAMVVAAGLPTPGAAVVLVAGVGVLTIGEMLISAGGWQLSYSLAPPSARSKFLSVFGLASAGQKVVGPLLVISLIAHSGTYGWVGLALVFVVAGLLAGALGRRLAKEGDAKTRFAG
jgi:hypothetical protein